MKKRKLWVLAVCAVALCFSLQSCDNDEDPQYWSKLYSGGDSGGARYCAKASNGNFLVLGYRNLGMRRISVLMEVGADGGIVWENGFDDVTLSAVRQVSDGGYYIAGINGNGKVLVARLDASRAILWQKECAEMTSMSGMDLTADDGVVLCNSSAYGEYSVVMKLDGAGAVQWARRLDFGSSKFDAREIVSLPDGGFMVGGNDDEYYSGVKGVHFVRLDADGVVLWGKGYTARDSGGLCPLRSLSLTPDGGFIAGINGYGNAGDDSDIWKLDEEATITWHKTFRSITPPAIAYWGHGDTLVTVMPVSDGGYIAYGSTFYYNVTSFIIIGDPEPGQYLSDGYLFMLKLDSVGDVEWQKSYNDTRVTERQRPTSWASAAIETDDGYLAVATTEIYNNGPGNMLVIKTDEKGAIPGSGLSIQTDQNILWGFNPDPVDASVVGTDVSITTTDAGIAPIAVTTTVTDL